MLIPESGTSAVLRYVTAEVITNKVCANDFGSFLSDTNVCASGVGGKASCTVSIIYIQKNIGLNNTGLYYYTMLIRKKV